MPRIEITGIEKNVDAKFLKENIEQFEMINANVQKPSFSAHRVGRCSVRELLEFSEQP